jgi:acyl-CoA reductase-like NAD-dependent aldehyde dehydrogenase
LQALQRRQQETAVVAAPVYNDLFIENRFVPASGDRRFAAIDPATEEVITQVAKADARDVDAAVQSAHRALKGPWRALAPQDRGALLHRLADIIDRHKDRIAQLETLDMGKPLRESYNNIARSVRTCRYYAGAADRLEGQSIPVDRRTFNFSIHEPLGVTAHITPWNYPFANACRSLPTAIAAGCTVVLKPASDTSLSTLLLAELCREAGFPDGVVNVVTGSGSEAGAALARHPLVRGITFTGSVGTGQRIMEMAAEHIRPVVLELGGKNPQVVFADADMELALGETLRGAFTNAGQVCTGISRVLVQRSAYGQYVEALKARVDALTVGPGADNLDMGPLVSEAHRATVEEFVAIAHADGARLVSGGRRPDGLGRGWYYRPTVFDEVTSGMRIAQEEVFGPLLVVMPFDDDEDALNIANGIDFGLTAGVFTRDIDRAMRFARDLEAGMVWVNEWFQSPVQVPHGGIKTSGIGREQGMLALANYTQVKDIAVRFR